MRADRNSFVIAVFAGGLLFAANSTTRTVPPVKTASSGNFDVTVKPVLQKSCTPCHNDRMQSGSLNLAPFLNSASVTDANHREGWEMIVQKIRTGEMPPKGMPRPPQEQVNQLITFIHGEFERADKLVKPDPGRVTARRLNRVEYSNTIRDLLGVDFRAEKDFPADDSGYGFDNIGDVLTISPVLMEKYLQAAERIAARAIGADPLPKKPLEFLYHSKDGNIQRLDRSTIAATHNVDFEGEYIVRIGLPGERGEDAAPVNFKFWMDGKVLHEQLVETKPSRLEYFEPYSEIEFKVHLNEGDHVFRAGFVGDEYVKTLEEKYVYSAKDKKNKFLNMIKFIGPFPAKVEKASRKKILICDPGTGPACVQRIVSTLARRAYRRPVTSLEVTRLLKFVNMARADGQSLEQGIQVAIAAMLVSPHFLFRVERDTNPNDPAAIHKISDLELASRLSYFLWSSMPDEELLKLAKASKLRPVLDAQIRRMLDDPKSTALADNFAGQWLETRNLDSVKPDPVKFPDWKPELRDAMKMETRLFFEAVLRENLPLTAFLDSRFTFLNEVLAKHYGIDSVTGADFRRVELTTPQRGGILSHGSVLTVSSYPTRTSPVIRGKYVLENILGTPPPPPPPDVPALDESKVASGSLRKQLEEHRSNAVCASCHSRMDVLGFGLENYDAIGKWRTAEGKFPIDSSGTLPNGQSFTTPAELRVLLKDDLNDFSRSLTEKMLTYALGRGLERYDRRTVDDINKKVAGSGYKFQTLVFEIAKSLPFQSRRGEVSRNQTAPKTKEVAKR